VHVVYWRGSLGITLPEIASCGCSLWLNMQTHSDGGSAVKVYWLADPQAAIRACSDSAHHLAWPPQVDKALRGTLSSVVPTAAGFQSQREAVAAAVKRSRAMDAAAAAPALLEVCFPGS
jgi:hypothetical protein